MSGQGGGSKTMLIIGSILLVLALVCGILAVMGQRSMMAGGAALQDSANRLDEAETINEDLTVPGTTKVTLEPGEYVLGLAGDDIGGDGFDANSFEFPPVTWKISGPEEVVVSTKVDSVTVGNSTRAGTFSVSQAGDYEIAASLPEGESTDYAYNVETNGIALAGEVMGDVTGDAMKTGIGGLQMVLGGLCSGVLGLIGLVMVALHLMNSR